MSDVSRSVRRRARARLLAGAALLTVAAAAAPALAQQTVAMAPAEDGLAPRSFYLEADQLTVDNNRKVVTAEGEVEVRYEGRTLRAGKVVYDQGTGIVTASGQATIINTDGTVTFADSIVLDEDLRAGVATGFSARLEGDVKIAAATAVRRSETINELNRAIYTPCPVCVEDGETKGPTWSISADKVVQDREKQIIYYRNATITLFGIPVFYAPVFWHADPTADRKSGFLPPRVAASKRRGLSYEQPYLHVISPSEDIVISPQLNAKVRPFVNARWRKRFETGQVNVRAGYTYDYDRNGEGDAFGEQTSRSYVLADGAFDIDAYWRWGFAAERTSDDLIFDKYEIGDVFLQRGLFATDDQRLTSQLYAVRQDQQSYLSISAISIQGLRPTDIDRAFPLIAPLIEGRWEPTGPVAGGRLRLLGSAVALTREQSQALGSMRDEPGLDSRRVTGEADWRRNFTFASGLRISPFANLRGDVYSLDDLPGGEDGVETRVHGVAGVDLRMPFFRRDGDRTIVLEPLVQAALSPDADPVVVGYESNGDPIYLNEDGAAFEVDETNLMRTHRVPGFDLYEGGQRLNVAGRATVTYDDGRMASLFVGRTFRAEEDTALPARSGLRSQASDWIVSAEAVPVKGVQLFSRARLGDENGQIRRLEVGADVNVARGRGFFRYMRDNEDVTGVEREDIDFAGDVLVTRNWGVTFRGVRDLEQDTWRRQELGGFYRDECLDLAVVWVREETFNRSLGPSDSIQVRLTLATLGDKGY